MDPEPTSDASRLLDVRTSRSGERILLVVEGEIDAATCDQLGAALDDAVSPDHSSSVELDVRGVSFIDSSGLRVLVHADQQLGGSRHLRLVAPDATFRRLLAITGLDDLFDIAD